MTTLDWVVGVFVTAAAWVALYRGLERAARQHDAAQRRELRRSAERAEER